MIKNLINSVILVSILNSGFATAQTHIESLLSDDQETTFNAISSLGMVDDQVAMAGNPIIQMDLNGNGMLDYVTASHAAGNVFIYFDLPNFNNPVYTPSASSNLVISGAGGLGSSFAKGDINNDGIDDLVIGAKSQGTEGEVYIILGNTNMPTTGTQNVFTFANCKIQCSIDGGNDDIFGDQVECLDINGDGFDDIAVGASVVWYQGTGDGPGDVYVIYGSSSMPNIIQARTQANIIITGSGNFDHIGKYVGKANFNNDGYDDLIFSSAYWPGAGVNGQKGKVWILFGGSSLNATYSTGSFSNGITEFEGPFQGDEMCYFDSGDINGDGNDDLLLAAGKYPAQFNTGIVYILYGPINPGTNYTPLNWPNKTIIEPQGSTSFFDAKFGQSMAVKDVDNDGYEDILIGAPGYSKPPLYYGTRTTEGAAFLVKGGPNLGTNYTGLNESIVFYSNNQNQIIGANYNISFGRAVNFINSNDNKLYSTICDVERNKIYFFKYDENEQIKLEKNCSPIQKFDVSQTQMPKITAGDYNNDGYKDFICSGFQGALPKTILYKNSLGNSFTYSNISNINYQVWDIKTINFNNDQFSDIIVTGGSQQGAFITKIYINQGGNNFIDAGLNIDGFGYSAIDCGDYNNDGYEDFIICGQLNNGTLATRVYKNNNGFSLTILSTSITAVKNGDVKWSDYNNDGNADFFICGETSSSKIAELYVNTNGNFILNQGTISPAPFRAVSNAKIDWGDVDNDGDLDLVYSGYGRNPFKEYTKLYRNEGSGNFTDVYYNGWTNEFTSGLILREVKWSEVKIVDVNNNGSKDIVIIGSAGYNPFSEAYNSVIHLNNGFGKFKDVEPIQVPQLRYAAMCSEDFDADGDLDFVLLGEDITGAYAEIILNKRNSGTNCFSINPISTGTVINTNSELVHVYPNPTASNLNIEINKEINSEELIMKIMNVYGQAILTDIITNSNYETGDLSNGLYYIEIFDKSNNVFYKQKFIVQK